MNRQQEYKNMWNKINDFRCGKLKSNYYTDEEIQEKRLYFESCLPDKKLKISKNRWLGEIKRQFDFSDNIKKCPDYCFTRLEFILKFGL